MEFLLALGSLAFLQNALLGAVLASVACGVVGSYVVVRRIGYMAGGIAHSVLGGMGIAYYYGADPLTGALIAAIIAAVLIGYVNLYLREQEDTLISALWAIGMAIGILFISRTPGYNVDLMSYLFGNVLLITPQELKLMAFLDVLILAIVLAFNKQFTAVCFDEEFARLRGVNVTAHYLLLLCLVALTVVILIQVVGLILVIALLTLPAAIASHYASTVRTIMMLATLLGIGLTSGGMMLAYSPDLPAGATIIVLAGVCYLFSCILAAWRHRHQR